MAIPAEPGAPPVLNEMAAGYGLGWFVGEYQGQRLLSHGGTAFGFTAEIAFLPEADLGLVVLTNESQAGTAYVFTLAVQFRLLELLFDQPAEIDPFLPELARRPRRPRPPRSWPSSAPVDPAAVAPYLGRYANPALGEVTVALRGGPAALRRRRALVRAAARWWGRRPPTCSTTARW